jgi:hypothetical protein
MSVLIYQCVVDYSLGLLVGFLEGDFYKTPIRIQIDL